MLSKKAIDEFAEIHFKDTGERLSAIEAKSKAEDFYSLFKKIQTQIQSKQTQIKGEKNERIK